MKVVYKKTICDTIDEVILDAQQQHKEIDYIELPTKEFDLFYKYSPFSFTYTVNSHTGRRKQSYRGIDIVEKI